MDSGEYSCKMCGRCCHQVIPVTIYDIHRIAMGLDMADREVFERCVSYVTSRDGNIFAMKRKDDGSCTFLDEDNKCSIHSLKPRVCSFYPCPDILEKDKNLWGNLYLASASYEVFWEHSMAENHTKRYIQRFGTYWNEDGYFEVLKDIEIRVITECGETLCVASDEAGLPIVMKHNCSKCTITECRLETEITLKDISRIAQRTQTPIRSIFDTAVAKQPHTYTGGLKLRKQEGGTRCIYYFGKEEHCSIHEFRPRFCQFVPCKLKVSDKETWRRFFYASGDIESQWELEVSVAVTRKYVKDAGLSYNRAAFEKYNGEIDRLMKNSRLKYEFLGEINQYRYDTIPIQPIVCSSMFE